MLQKDYEAKQAEDGEISDTDLAESDKRK